MEVDNNNNSKSAARSTGIGNENIKKESPKKKLKHLPEEPRNTRSLSFPSSSNASAIPSTLLKTKTQSYFITLAGGLEFLGEEEIREVLQPSVIKRIDKGGKIFFATDK